MNESDKNHRSKSLIRFFAHHKLAASLLMVLVFLFGAYSLFKLNIRYIPPLNINVITISVPWAGASPKDVEQSITTPIENNLKRVNGVKTMSSLSTSGLSFIVLEFKAGTDMSQAQDQVRSEVDLVRNLPQLARKPRVEQVEVDERLARIVFSSDDGLDQLRPYAEKFERELLNKPSISKVGVDGLPQRILSIGLTPLQMAALRRSFSQIGTQISAQSKNVPAGMVGLDEGGHQLRANEEKRSAQAYEQLPITTGDSSLLMRVMDIATVTKDYPNNPKLVYYKGKPAVSFTVFRAQGQNALATAKDIYAWEKEVKSQLPDGMHVHVYEEFWQLIKDRINVLLANGVIGLLLIFVLLFLFLNTRVAFWVALSIPISLSAALFALYLMGGTINMISLFAMIMSLGIIVDDTIVVAEQAVTEYDSGTPALEAVITGARKMFIPIMASSVTTVAAFLPLMLLSGIFGEVLIAIPRVVICVILASLIECFLILPMHLKFSLRGASKHKPFRIVEKLQGWFDRLRLVHFKRLVTATVNHSWVTLSVCLSSFIIMVGVLVGGYVNFDFFPSPSGRVVDINVNFLSGVSTKDMVRQLNAIDQVAIDLGQDLKKKYGDVMNTSVVFPHKDSERRQPVMNSNTGSVVIDLVPPEGRSLTNDAFIKELKQKIKLYPGVENITISAPRQGPPGGDIEINLLSENPTALKQAAVRLKSKLNSYVGVSNVTDDMPYAQSEYVFKLKPEAKQLGLTVQGVGRQLSSAFSGHLALLFNKGQQEFEVKVRLSDDTRNKLGTLNHFPIITQAGNSIPLSNVVSISTVKGFDTLRHLDGKLSVKVLAEVDSEKNNPDKIVTNLKSEFLPKLETQQGVTYVIKGKLADQGKTLTEMKYAVLLALALIFIVLSWVSSSYSWALFVMLAIPFGLEGAVFGHLLLGKDLTLLSLFGFFGLTGIVVNDSIILLFRYKELKQEGLAKKEAIIAACTQRFRAVIMTSLTTIAGLLPLLFEKSLQAQFLIPMAISICFGLLFSTAIILLMIPAAINVLQREKPMKTSEPA